MKTGTLSTRVDLTLIARLDRFETGTGIERASLVRAALSAALDFYESQGSITFPLRIADASKIDAAPMKAPRGKSKSPE